MKRAAPAFLLSLFAFTAAAGETAPGAAAAAAPAAPPEATQLQPDRQPAAVQAQPAESQPAQAQPAQSQPAQSQPAQSQPAQSQPAQSQPAQAKPASQEAAPQEAAPQKPAETTPPAAKSGWKFEVHGFVGASLYAQNAVLNDNGGSALFVSSVPKTDRYVFGGDVRQTRLSLAVSGPGLAGGVTPRGVIEVDAFGLDSFGPRGDVSVLPRLRLAIAELTRGNTTLRFGQDHHLTLGGPMVAQSVGHVANPLIYTAGLMGWRAPGIGVFQNVPTGALKLELALQVTRAIWNAPQTTVPYGENKKVVLPNSAALSHGEESGLPSVQARAKVKGAWFEAWLAGHWSRADRSGQGAEDEAPNLQPLDVAAAVAGGKASRAGFTLQGSAYLGRNLAPLIGNIGQFQADAASAKDVSEWGAWAQLGYDLTPVLSVWALGGIAQPDRKDAVKSLGDGARVRNLVGSFMLRYQESGFATGLEYTHWRTTTDVANALRSLDGDQLMLSGFYFF